MSIIQDEFFRRYATSPIHVPRLERLIAAYAEPHPGDEFARAFIEWDRAAADGEAARVVTEILALLVDERGAIVRLTEGAVRGAIDWLAARGPMTLAERAHLLRAILAEATQAHRGNRNPPPGEIERITLHSRSSP